jgi:hypothetical protein
MALVPSVEDKKQYDEYKKLQKAGKPWPPKPEPEKSAGK